MGKTALAYLLSIPALAIFAFGVFSKLSFWLSGSVDPEELDETPLGRRGALSLVASAIFSKKIFRIVGGAFLEAIIARRLFRLSRTRWTIHALMLYGFMALLAGDAVATRLSLRGAYVKDDPALAILFELGGVSIIAGVALALARRLFLRRERLGDMPSDYVAPLLMALVLATGFLTEAFRLLAEGVPAAAAKYSFVGVTLANVFAGSETNWVFVHDAVWLIHAVISFVFIAYIPYGKFFHFMVAPLVAGINAAGE